MFWRETSRFTYELLARSIATIAIKDTNLNKPSHMIMLQNVNIISAKGSKKKIHHCLEYKICCE